jgi:hypothetical protein
LAAGQTAVVVLLGPVLNPDTADTTWTLPGGIVAAEAAVTATAWTAVSARIMVPAAAARRAMRCRM